MAAAALALLVAASSAGYHAALADRIATLGGHVEGEEKVLFAIRHGESDWNAGGVFEHFIDVVTLKADAPLTPKGFCDALALHEAMWAGRAGSSQLTEIDRVLHDLGQCCQQGKMSTVTHLTEPVNALDAQLSIPGLNSGLTVREAMTHTNRAVTTRVFSNLRRAIDTGSIGLWVPEVGLKGQPSAIVTNHIQELSSGIDARSNLGKVGDSPQRKFGKRGKKAIAKLVEQCKLIPKENAKQDIKTFEENVNGYEVDNLEPLWWRANSAEPWHERGNWKPVAGFDQQYLNAGNDAPVLHKKFMQDLTAIPSPVVVASGHSHYWMSFVKEFGASSQDPTCGDAMKRKIANGGVMMMTVSPAERKVTSCKIVWGGFQENKK